MILIVHPALKNENWVRKSLAIYESFSFLFCFCFVIILKGVVEKNGNIEIKERRKERLSRLFCLYVKGIKTQREWDGVGGLDASCFIDRFYFSKKFFSFLMIGLSRNRNQQFLALFLLQTNRKIKLVKLDRKIIYMKRYRVYSFAKTETRSNIYGYI